MSGAMQWIRDHYPVPAARGVSAEAKIAAIRELIAAYREADPPDIGHRIYVDIETILGGSQSQGQTGCTVRSVGERDQP